MVTEAQQAEAPAWSKDLRVPYKGYEIHAVQGPRGLRFMDDVDLSQSWQLADKQGRKYGGFKATYEECAVELDAAVQQDWESDNWSWYVGCEWASDVQMSWNGYERYDGDYGPEATYENGDQPGSARVAAYEVYNKLCKEPGGVGCCFVGMIRPEDGERMEQEQAERDPQDEAEAREEAYDRYLEENHDQLAWQDRYDAWRNEY